MTTSSTVQNLRSATQTLLLASVGSMALTIALPVAAAPAEVATNDDIIVTANKKSEKLSAIGGGISAISGDLLEKLNANTLEDYLAFVPGVSFTSYGRPGQNQITIRGISALALGSAISTYVDNIPVGSASNEAQGSSYSPDIDPADLDHVEVLKGPQGTLYGASSLGGVLKYVTKAPRLSGTELTTAAEVNGIDHGGIGYKLRAAGSTSIVEDVLGVRASAFYRHDAGFINNDLTGAKEVNRDNAWGVRASLLYQPAPALQIKLGAVYQKTDANGLNAVSYGAAPNPLPPFVATYGDLDQHLRLSQPNRVTDQIYSAEIRYDFDWASLISSTGVSREDIFRNSDVTGTYTRPSYTRGLRLPAGSTASLVNDYNIKKTSEELRLQSASNGKSEWVVGGFYQRETSHTDGSVNIRDASLALLPQPAGIASLSNTENTLREFAGFVNATWYIRPNLDLSGGYRHSNIVQHNVTNQTGYVFTPSNPTFLINRLDNTTDNVDTFSAGLRWRVETNLLLYARAASGFRPGGGRGQPPVVIPNFKFTYDPDQVWSYETGVKATLWNGRATIDVDGFYIDWSHIQAIVPANNDPFPFFVVGNGGKAVSKGVEGQFSVRPVRGLSLTAGLAYTDAHFAETVGNLNKGDQLQGVAKYTASLQADYEHALTDNWQAFGGADYRYRSSMLDQLGNRMPSYEQLGFHAGVEHGGTRIGVFVTNVTDTRGLLGYTGGGNQLGDPYRYAVSPPRTIGASVTQKW